MVPNGWSEVRFSDVADIGNGQVDPREDPYKSMIHIGPDNVSSDTGQISGTQFCAELGLISGKYEFDENALVYSKIRPNLNKVCRPRFKGVCSADMYPIWAKSEVADTDYLFHFMLGPVFYKFAVSVSMRTGMPKINRNDLNSAPVPLPPLPEQKKIAEILSTWDDAIAANEDLLANSRQRKKALMQQLLTGKIRLKDRNGELFAGDWTDYEFGEFATIKSPKFAPGKSAHYPCIELEHIEQDVGKIVGSISSQSVNSMKNVFSSGSVLFGKLRPYLRKYAMPDFDGVCSTEIWVISPLGGVACSEYIYQLVQSEAFVDGANKSSGSKMPRADWSIVRTLPFRLPSLPEQLAISEVLSVASAEIEAIEQRIDNLKTQKKALMQQLLTGKKRVKVDEVVQ